MKENKNNPENLDNEKMSEINDIPEMTDSEDVNMVG